MLPTAKDPFGGVPSTPPSVNAKRGRRRWGETLAFLALAGPAFVWFAVFMLRPFTEMFRLSFRDWYGLLRPSEPIGWGNYSYMLQDPIFWTAARNSVIQIGVALPVMIVLAFTLGFFLSLRPPGYQILSVIFFTPAIISAPVRIMMFLGLYAPDGLINQGLRTIGLDALTRVWAADQSTALGAVISADLWAGVGFTAVLFAAHLSGISKDIFESAELDGATWWVKLWRVAYLISRGYVGVIAMLQFLWLFLSSAQNVLLLTNGGPGNASTTLAFYLYDQAFVASRLGYSQAIGVLLFVFGLVGMLIIRASFRETK